jgi:hypothetical protein
MKCEATYCACASLGSILYSWQKGCATGTYGCDSGCSVYTYHDANVDSVMTAVVDRDVWPDSDPININRLEAVQALGAAGLRPPSAPRLKTTAYHPR